MRDESSDLPSYIDQVTFDTADSDIYSHVIRTDATGAISAHAIYPAYISLPMGNYPTDLVEKALEFYFQHHPEELL